MDPNNSVIKRLCTLYDYEAELFTHSWWFPSVLVRVILILNIKSVSIALVKMLFQPKILRFFLISPWKLVKAEYMMTFLG